MDPRQESGWLSYVLQGNPPSRFCNASDDALSGYQPIICPRGTALWQFSTMAAFANWLIVAGMAVILAILHSCLLVRFTPVGHCRILAFLHPFLLVATAVGMLLQAALLLWFCWWATLLSGSKGLAGLMLAVVVLATAGICRAVHRSRGCLIEDGLMEGVTVARAEAPALWQRIDGLAARLGATPPDHIILGVGTDFYVTEAPVDINWRSLYGRKLYLSMPLLRLLSSEQADGVMLHELSHLHCGETAVSARLESELGRLEHSAGKMAGSVMLLAPFCLLTFYHLLFTMAWCSYRRRRELLADRAAVRQASPAVMAESLIRGLAWNGWRAEIERSFLAHFPRQWELRRAVATGFAEYVHSPLFIAMMDNVMNEKNTRHPFELHPPISRRMRNIGYNTAGCDYRLIALRKPERGWLDLIPDSEEIEQQLWQKYQYRQLAENEKGKTIRHIKDVKHQHSGENASVYLMISGLLRRVKNINIRYKI